MNGGARRAVARSTRIVDVDGERVELVARNSHPEAQYRAGQGWVARVLSDPAHARFACDNERLSLDAARERIAELRTMKALEHEISALDRLARPR